MSSGKPNASATVPVNAPPSTVILPELSNIAVPLFATILSMISLSELDDVIPVISWPPRKRVYTSSSTLSVSPATHEYVSSPVIISPRIAVPVAGAITVAVTTSPIA